MYIRCHTWENSPHLCGPDGESSRERVKEPNGKIPKSVLGAAWGKHMDATEANIEMHVP